MSMLSGLVPMIGTPLRFELQRQLQRRLAAVLHDHAQRLFHGDDLEHVFQRHRLEVQAVAGVVVGGHRLRVAVDHDGLVAVLAHRQRRMHAAVVELDALADAVGPAAQHHDLLARGRLGLALLVVGGVHVGRGRGELGRAGVHTLVDRAHAEGVAAAAQVVLVGAQQLGQALVGKALLLQEAQSRPPTAIRACGRPAPSRWTRSPGSAPGTTGRSRFPRRSRPGSCRCGRHRPRTGCARGRPRRSPR